MKFINRATIFLAFAAIAAMTCHAQPSIGTPAFGSYAGGPDVLNLGNLNAHWDIPIRSKAGRGTNFTYDLTYDNSIWYPATVNGTKVWTPVSNQWGWSGLQQSVGTTYYTYSSTLSTSGQCPIGPQPNQQSPPPLGTYYVYNVSGLVYVDLYGQKHPFTGFAGGYFISPGGSYGCPAAGYHGPTTPSAISTSDGSGLTAQYSQGANYNLVLLITTKAGATFNPVDSPGTMNGSNSYSFTDNNGNQITGNAGVYTDTLGQTALTIAGTYPTNAPPTVVMKYANASGGTEYYTVNYSAYTVKTNFQCSGVTDYAATNQYLVSSIALPDGRSYTFTYETTPGYSSDITGRIASVTLPTGGKIQYQYTGGSNGIECADGSTAGLTRHTPDGTWTYARSSSSPWTTTITAPAASQGVQDKTVVTFLEDSLSNFYEISRQVYSGSNTLLETILHCYETSSSNCSTTAGDIGTSVVLPIQDVTTTYQWPNSSGISSGTYDTYDSVGNNTLHKVFDYGSAGSGTYSSTPLQVTTTTYSSASGTGYYVEQPHEVKVQDGQTTPNTISDTVYSYSTSTTATSGTPSHVAAPPSLGNLTSVQRWVSGSTYLTSNYTYYDTGNIQTATDVNSAQTSYTYGACGNSFPTQVTSQTGGTTVTSLSTLATWNCAGGVQLTNADVNGNTTTYAYGSDPYWRPTTVTNNATGAAVTLTYPTSSSNSSSSSMSFNNGNSTNTSVVTYDNMGRSVLQQTQQAPGSANYDSVAVEYDSRGRAAYQSLPYTSSKGNIVTTGPGTTTVYDALNRAVTVTDGGGGTTTYAYTKNDVLTTIGPTVTVPGTENLKKRNLEHNGAGWLMSVCEMTTLSGSGACGQSSPNTGYLTKYKYDGGGRLIQVQQNSQSGSSGVQARTVAYDGLSRKTSESIPEWSAGTGAAGLATYTYDSISSGTCSGTYKGDLVKSVDNMQNITCYTYDKQHRPLSTVVASGSYASVTPAAYYVYDAATYNGTAMANAKGTLAEAYTCATTACSSKLTDVFVSTSPVTSGNMSGGAQAKMWEKTPHSSSYFLTTDTYYPNGAVGAITAALGSSSIGIPNLSFGVDGEGRPYSASDGTNSLVMQTGYNSASAPTSITYGNASTGSGSDVDSFTYDPNTGRPTNLAYNIKPTSGSYAVTTALTWNANGSLQRMVYTDGSPTPMSQNCTYTADDLRRIAGVDCGSSAWAQNFAYDPFGNIAKSVPPGRTGSTYSATGYSTATNQVVSGISPSPTYDKNGNQLTSTPATLSWNAWNVPISVNSTTATYDALGRIVEKGVGSTYTQFVFRPSGASLAVYSGSLSKGTVPLPGGNTAIYNSSGLSFIRHTDWLGSSRFATTWAHAVYSKTAYAPFGETYNEWSTTGATPDRSFAGQDQDILTGTLGTGVYDFLFRKYDPSSGRWLSPDPAGWSAVNTAYPQSLNRYVYAMNDPLRLVDPNGLDCAYLSNSGVSIESIDQQSNAGECAANGGYWADGGITDFQVNPDGSYTFSSLDANFNTIITTFSSGDNNNSTAYMDVMSYFANYYAQLRQQQPQNQSMWSMSPQQRIYQIALQQPTLCGGGAFAYGGRSVDAGIAEGFAGGIVEADSRYGISNGQLFEAGGGEGIVGGVGRVYANGSSEMLIYGGPGIGVPGAHVSGGYVAYPSGVGVYADGSAGGWEGGAGAYVNITTNQECKSK